MRFPRGLLRAAVRKPSKIAIAIAIVKIEIAKSFLLARTVRMQANEEGESS